MTLKQIIRQLKIPLISSNKTSPVSEIPNTIHEQNVIIAPGQEKEKKTVST